MAADWLLLKVKNRPGLKREHLSDSNSWFLLWSLSLLWELLTGWIQNLTKKPKPKNYTDFTTTKEKIWVLLWHLAAQGCQLTRRKPHLISWA